MWPLLLDMTKEESMQSLRNLELEAFAHLVSALRAQGPLDPDKRKLLKDTGLALNITQDRHKAEIRRAVNDERLNTIAYHVTGLTESLDDWAQEGRRTVPLIPRMAPQTAYSAIADEAAENASQTNKQLPLPALTERKRLMAQPSQLLIPETNKTVPFRVPEPPKVEESKKRKLPICTENSSLAQHLLGPPKMSRPQHIYRQRPKGMIKDQTKFKPQQQQLPPQQQQTTKMSFTTHAHPHPALPPPCLNGPKINVVQNITLPLPASEETIEQIQNEVNSYTVQKPSEPLMPSCSNENQAPRPKMAAPSSKPAIGGMTFKPSTAPGPSGDSPKSMKMVPSKKSTKPSPLTQKLIVVSNAQTIQNSSILQKTLSIPLVKNISMRSLEKFKIVTTSSPQQIAATSNNINSFKHKVVTVKANPTAKKVIPLSQILSSKGGIKVLPLGGKIVGKTTTTTASSPLYIVNTVGSGQNKTTISTQPPSATTIGSPSGLVSATLTPPPRSPSSKENGKSSVLGDIMKASGVTTDDFDAQIEEFRIPNNHLCNNNKSQNVAATAAVTTGIEQQLEEQELVENEKEEDPQNVIIIQENECILDSKVHETLNANDNISATAEVDQLTVHHPITTTITNTTIPTISESARSGGNSNKPSQEQTVILQVDNVDLLDTQDDGN